MNGEKITEILKNARRTLSLNELSERSGLSKAELKPILAELTESGSIVSPRQGKYCHPSVLKLILCKARSSANAPTFARPLDKSADLFLEMPYDIAFDGDLIFVRETQGGEKRRGTLVSIVKRARSTISGTLYVEKQEPFRKRHRSKGRLRQVHEDKYYALVTDHRLPKQAVVVGRTGGAETGDLCLFEVVKWPVKNGQMVVSVIESLGKSESMDARLNALCAMHEISSEFTPEALDEAGELGEDPRVSDINGRLDLRGETIFTIDGADAQDFDDAVSLKILDGGWELGVHIADVSYYVKPGSALDANARERGTSVYLPGRTIPMLPEALCNCLCSLMPNRDRLSYSAIIEFDKNLEPTLKKLTPSVIRSQARLTYEDVNEMFAGRKSSVPAKLREILNEMNVLSKKLHQKRVNQGSLELDLPEMSFEIGEDGQPIDMGVRQRGDAQRLIEEFMLAANRAVALHAEKTDLPFPYRVHEKPDAEKLEALESTLAALGKPMQLSSLASQKQLQSVLSAFSDEGRSVIISETVLRSMSKARYSEKNLGHFGLAFKDYCHFTSPIRRYPDLLAHRMLRLQATCPPSEEEAFLLTQSIHTLTEEASLNEERAAKCERDADNLMCAAYLSRHKQKIFGGVITRFVKKGACVTIPEGFSGLIPFKNMDDIYSVDEEGAIAIGRRTKRILRLGDGVSVRCSNADLYSGSLEFELLPPGKPKNGKRR